MAYNIIIYTVRIIIIITRKFRCDYGKSVLIYNIRERIYIYVYSPYFTGRGERLRAKGEQAIIRFLGDSKLYTHTHTRPRAQIIILRVLEKRIYCTLSYIYIYINCDVNSFTKIHCCTRAVNQRTHPYITLS